jgi:hypothetical protein
LDRLCHLEKDMTIAAMQCDVSLAEDEIAKCPPLAIPLRLGFFSYEAKVKLQLTLAASLYSNKSFEDYALDLISCNIEYGKADLEESIRDALKVNILAGLPVIVPAINQILSK